MLILGELGVAITAGLGLAVAVATRVVYVDVPAHYATNIEAAPPELNRQARLDNEAWVEVTISDASPAQIALYALHDGPPLLLALAMLVLLHRAVAKARTGQPFAAAVSNTLFGLGALLWAGGVFIALARLTASWYLIDSISPLPAFYMAFNPLWWLAGFGFLAAGEVVRRGTAIRAELDEVI